MTHHTLGTPRKPLRTWPLAVIAALFAAIMLFAPTLFPDAGLTASLLFMIGGVVSALLITLWWLFFSRARWTERLGGLALIAVGVVLTQHGGRSFDRRRRPGHARLHLRVRVLRGRAGGVGGCRPRG